MEQNTEFINRATLRRSVDFQPQQITTKKKKKRNRDESQKHVEFKQSE